VVPAEARNAYNDLAEILVPDRRSSLEMIDLDIQVQLTRICKKKV
jgi:hypothetical protein